MHRRMMAAAVLLAWGATAFGARLPKTVVPSNYAITFEPDLQQETFRGEETITVSLKEPSRKITLNSAELRIDEATVESRGKRQRAEISLSAQDETATLYVAKLVPAGVARIHLRFSGEMSKKLRGLYLSRTERRKYAVTQFESTYARRAFPSFDEPAMKATFDISVVADEGDTAISNGRIVSDTPGPQSGKHTIHFAVSPKMSTYLVALAVGDFKCRSGAAEGIPIRVCSVPEKFELTRFAMDAVQHEVPLFNTYYGVRYPFPKLDLIAFPDFEAGAMENTAAITYRESALLVDEKSSPVEARRRVAMTTSHEIAHQWFGDLVTLNWWDDLWLNEGFASWATSKAIQPWHPEWSTDADAAGATNSALNADSLPSTRPIRTRVESPAEIETLFDGIAYGKAAAMLRMGEMYVGEESFRKGIHAYLTRYSWGNATAENFWDTVAASTGKPVDRIFASYVDQPGSPLVTAAASCEGDTTKVTLSQRRMYADRAHFTKGSDQTWVVPVAARDLDNPSAGPIHLLLKDREQTFEVPGCHPHLFINYRGRGLYRTQHAPELLQGGKGLTSALEVTEQVTLLNDDWALVRIGAEPVARHMALVSSMRESRDRSVVGTVRGQIAAINAQLLSGEQKEAFQAWVAAYARPILTETGWTPEAGETDDRRQLRLSALALLGDVARDGETVQHATELVERALSDGASSQIDPSVLGVAVEIAASGGGAALWERYAAAAKAATTPAERSRYLGAFGDFEDPVLARRTIDLALGPDVRSQDTMSVMAGAIMNPATREAAWTYLKQRWPDVEKKLSGPAVANSVALAGGFCDPAQRADVERFFSERKVPGGERRLRQSLERIDACIEFRSLQRESLKEWLGAAGAK